MVLVPGGKFFMGSDEPDFKLWQPAHKTILDTFCIDVHEVTASEYKACSDQGECKRPPELPNWPKTAGTSDEDHEKKRAAYAELCNFGKPGRENHPINCVSWAQAMAYCARQGKTLPTEAQWEYAARGSGSSFYPWGEEAPGRKVCASTEGTIRTATCEAGSAAFITTLLGAPDPQGAADLAGNVWEWVSDNYDENYYQKSPGVDPVGPSSGTIKVRRGGSWHTWPIYARCSYRNINQADSRYILLGMRLLREVGPGISSVPMHTHVSKRPISRN